MKSGWQSQGLNTLAQLAHKKLGDLAAADLLRSLTAVPAVGGALDLISNDYLGLRANERFQADCYEAIRGLPVGSGASRLLGGEDPVFAELEAACAEWLGEESALYFSSGYAANEAVARALNLGDVACFSDALNHASMIDGLKLSRLPRDKIAVFPHRDYARLGQMLQASRAAVKLIFVESLYSMDGDYSALRELTDLGMRFNAALVVDEAHALGVHGAFGEGYSRELGLRGQVISVLPCGKAMAVSGALITGPKWLRELLINTARPFIYSTAPSPWVAKALSVAIPFVAGMHQERRYLQEIAAHVRRSLRELDFDTALSESHIIPVILGTNEKALAAAEALAAQGVVAKAVRPPTVPQGTARLRLSLRANLTEGDVNRIISAFASLRRFL